MRQQFFYPFPKLSLRLKVFQLLILLCISQNSMAQGWEKTYQVDGYEKALAEYMTLTRDGGYCMIGTVEIPDAKDIAVMKLDAEGSVQWTKYFGGPEEDVCQRIFQLADGGYIIGGVTFSNTVGSADYYLLRLDEFGDSLWSKTYGTVDYEEFNALTPTVDGGFLLMGELAPFYDKIHLIKVDEFGTQEWEKEVGFGVGKTEGRDIKNTSDGGYIISGYNKFSGTDDDEDFYLIKINSQGDSLWDFRIDSEFNEIGEDVIETSDGNFVIVGYKMYDADVEGDLYLVKTNASGDTLWTKTFGDVGRWERGFTLTEATNGDYVMAGNSVLNITNEGFGYIVRTDSDGNEVSQNFLTESNAVGYPANILVSPDNGFVIAGTGDSIMALIKTDPLLNSFTTYVQGNIFHDVDDDCSFDNGENALEGWIVLIDGEEDYFSITDSEGNYSILADTGNYILRVISPNELWATCNNFVEYEVILNDIFDTTNLDIPIQSVVDCPHMTINLSAPLLRRCFQNTYYIEYCNDGTLDEANAVVEVEFDSYLTINSASMNYSDLGNNLISFDIGNVNVGECGTITVDVTVDCDSTILGQTHCVTSHIYPDTFCLIPQVVWDSSSIAVTGTCLGDSVLFEIKNEGVFPTSAPRVVKVVEDNVIIIITLINLNPGETDSLVYYPTGKTLRIEVDQAEGHPGESNPSATVEGCGADQADWSLGFVTQYPMDDGNHFIDIDCHENVGSYDPNDKSAFPKGSGSEHYISKEDEIEYHIRFQNTGTDTAFTVVLRDTLSDFLDATTIRGGVSSHEYDFEILGNGELKFTFNNILLPDSTTNLEGSNGFVRFRIAQKPDNPPGTLITNTAGIYFDFNEPIFTNEVYHFLEIPTQYIVQELELCKGEVFENIEIYEDTIIVNTEKLSNGNETTATWVYMLEHSYSDSSILIVSGDEVEGEIIFNDTSIVIYHVAANGCDSIQTVEISVNIDDPFASQIELNIFPIPAEQELFIKYNLEKPEEVSIEMFNPLGQKIQTLADHEKQYAGNHFYKIEKGNLPVNVLFLKLTIGGKEILRRVVFSE